MCQMSPKSGRHSVDEHNCPIMLRLAADSLEMPAAFLPYCSVGIRTEAPSMETFLNKGTEVWFSG